MRKAERDLDPVGMLNDLISGELIAWRGSKRRLTTAEMNKFREWARERERLNYPGASIQIIVKEETDEDGNLIYSAAISREHVIPPSEVLS